MELPAPELTKEQHEGLKQLNQLVAAYESGFQQQLNHIKTNFLRRCQDQHAAFDEYNKAQYEVFHNQYAGLKRCLQVRTDNLSRACGWFAAHQESCGRGSQVWNRRSTTMFGRQFQYLRGHDLFSAHFREEFELNFRFDSPQELMMTWKRYHPNGKQWRSIQNLAIRRICRRHIYKNPPIIRSDDSFPASEYKNYEVHSDYAILPELTRIEHDEIWTGFEHLGECHYEWSKRCFHLWYEYELMLYRGNVNKSKKQVEKEVLRVDNLIADFIPTCNPQGYVMLRRDGTTVIPAPNTINAAVCGPAVAAAAALQAAPRNENGGGGGGPGNAGLLPTPPIPADLVFGGPATSSSAITALGGMGLGGGVGSSLFPALALPPFAGGGDPTVASPPASPSPAHHPQHSHQSHSPAGLFGLPSSSQAALSSLYSSIHQHHQQQQLQQQLQQHQQQNRMLPQEQRSSELSAPSQFMAPFDHPQQQGIAAGQAPKTEPSWPASGFSFSAFGDMGGGMDEPSPSP